jgi:dUTP pyrophosphatase
MQIFYKKTLDSAKLPVRATEKAAGYDIHAAEEMEIPPGMIRMVSTGFSMEVPEGFEAQIRPRSGLAKNHGITVINTPGTIDSDFRGTVGVLLINHSDKLFKVNVGDRIAQMVFAEHKVAEMS